VRLAGLVEYDGARFAGWAAQPDRRTVEGELSEALRTVLRQPIKLAVAGRTDAGVHASGQVVSFKAETDLSPPSIAYKATAVMPADLALRRCVAVSDGFDARRSARSRGYEYRLVNDEIRSPLRRLGAAYEPRRLDFGLLEKTGEMVEGVHDFSAFTPSKGYHVRFERVVSESGWTREGDLLLYRISSDSFLYGMVRTLVGTMQEVALGKRDIDDFEALLSGGRREQAGPAAPSRGLTLVNVGYDEDIWR
jgi:tRNA pseudouridine38-40 synthase